jgi:hypothetical protein
MTIFSRPRLSAEHIADRSKANWFTKIIASFQIIWFLSQTAGRAASGLTITPLEFFKIGYVVCALGMYYRYF